VLKEVSPTTGNNASFRGLQAVEPYTARPGL